MNKALRHLAYAVFVVFLCIAPIFAFAQDDGASASRLIDMPNITGDRGGSAMSEAVRLALGRAEHVVFNEDDMKTAASEAGVDGNYWDDPKKIVKVNKKARHDAVVIGVYNSRKPMISFTVYNAFNGEVLGTFDQRIKKKGKPSKRELNNVASKVTNLVKEIDAEDYPYEIIIKVTSDPPGATVTRGGTIVGTTPYEYKLTQIKGASEDWVITLPEKEPVTKHIAMDASKTYHIDFNSDEVEDIPRSGETGRGLPKFLIAVNISPTIFDFKISDQTNSKISHKSKVFPKFSLDFVFFPFTLFSENDYLHGLGIQLGGSFASPLLDTKFSYAKNANVNTKCTKSSDGRTYTCSTMEFGFYADIIYRLLLQKDDHGNLDHDGMAMDFYAGFYMLNHNVQTNPSYNGNNFGGIRIGVAYSTPLGIEDLRLAIKGNFNYNVLNEAPIRYNKLGEKRDLSLGANIGLDLMYDIWKGLFVRAGYDLFIGHNSYKGMGCSDEACTKGPRDSTTNVLLHEIKLGLGYMLY